ncbi:fatty-acid amide hydrolase 1-like, partial [Littorina saxatilis]|uniref:fatty-acid amide hydrolase 1-like n=1 Tax=Littorina saxatilis TaxID=31220 RepID=UPI0038B4FE0B
MTFCSPTHASPPSHPDVYCNFCVQNKLPARQKEAILSLSLSTLQSKLRSGELKAVDVLRAYQEQALKVNVKINCLTEAITDAQELAAACDETGDKTRLLHGIPVSLKENIGVKGYDRTGGLQINIGVPCDKDAVITQVLKRHGAIPFVRTNIPQAMLSYTCSNPIFGSTANPHNVLHTPGGSSGGEGAIIGAGGSIIGIGSDVGGSVRVPASFCGCCSLKPTLGRFSKMGFYTVTKGQTQISGVPGPMARDVDSLVVLTRVLSSPDMFELDASLPPLPFQQQLLNSTHRLRIGYYTWDGNLPPVPVVSRAVREAKKVLEDLGHTLVEFSPIDYSQKFAELFIGTMLGADQGQTLRSKVSVSLSSSLLLQIQWNPPLKTPIQFKTPSLLRPSFFRLFVHNL